MSEDYRFRLVELTSEELARTSNLLRLVFPKARQLTPSYLEWQYVLNPDGPALGCNAYLGDELVGHMSAIPMRTRLDGVELNGIFTMNGAVHPAHRGRKLQSGISHGIFEDAKSRGYAFCFATGNKYSTGPLLTRFQMVAPLQARIGFGLPRRHSGDFQPSFERVWSKEALEWRLANPEQNYRVGRRGGQLTVSAPSGRAGIGALLYHGPDAWGVPERIGSPSGHGPLKVWLGLDPGVDWQKSTFLNIPARLRPSPLNLMFKDLSGGSLYPDPARLVFRAIDFDPY